MWKLNQHKECAVKELRVGFRETLEELMDGNEKIMVLEGDLGAASDFIKIKASHPNQFLNMGIAESNMMGVAAGMSMRGYIPYVHTFSPFASRRVADQVFLEGVYAKNTIHIYGSDPGICAATNGGTHTTFEDIAIYRAFPGVEIFDPADDVQLKWLVKELANRKGVHYIRANRKSVPRIYEEGSEFTIGKGNVLREGTDVAIFSMGILIVEALKAAEELKQKGIAVEVVDMFTIKPLDISLVKKAIADKRLVVTFENHSIYNGLGSAVAEIMAEETCRSPLKRIGIEERTGQVGELAYLKKEYGLTAADLEKIILGSIKGDCHELSDEY